MSNAHALNVEDAKRYILGGRGMATLIGQEHRYTFKFGTPRDKKGEVIFVNVLNGSNNLSDYVYIGYIRDGQFIAGKKGRPDAPSYKAFAWYWTKLLNDAEAAKKATFVHEGVCACCGRALTVPESIERGIGPECAKRHG